MRNRTILILLLLLVAVFLFFKFDVITRVKIIAANIIYGEEVRNIKELRVIVEAIPSELDNMGLSGEDISRDLISKLEKAGIKILQEDEWQKVPGRPALILRILTVKDKERMHSFMITFEVTKSNFEAHSSNIYSREKVRTIWSTSGMGDGVVDIRKKIGELLDLFLQTHSGI
jgi:hypothetical protein